MRWSCSMVAAGPSADGGRLGRRGRGGVAWCGRHCCRTVGVELVSCEIRL